MAKVATEEAENVRPTQEMFEAHTEPQGHWAGTANFTRELGVAGDRWSSVAPTGTGMTDPAPGMRSGVGFATNVTECLHTWLGELLFSVPLELGFNQFSNRKLDKPC